MLLPGPCLSAAGTKPRREARLFRVMAVLTQVCTGGAVGPRAGWGQAVGACAQAAGRCAHHSGSAALPRAQWPGTVAQWQRTRNEAFAPPHYCFAGAGRRLSDLARAALTQLRVELLLLNPLLVRTGPQRHPLAPARSPAGLPACLPARRHLGTLGGRPAIMHAAAAAATW